MCGGPGDGRAGDWVASREADIAGDEDLDRGYPSSETRTTGRPMGTTRERLQELHAELSGCRACPRVVGTPVHPSAQPARILLVGQAPGPREASLGRPFAWTAGRTLFGWFASVLGADEETVRRHVYLSAVTRCFPGKAPGAGDRRGDGPPGRAGGGGGDVAPAGVRGTPCRCDPLAASVGRIDVASDGA